MNIFFERKIYLNKPAKNKYTLIHKHTQEIYMLHKLSYNRERDNDNNNKYVQHILNTAINMLTHMYIILNICMHTYKYRIPNLL